MKKNTENEKEIKKDFIRNHNLIVCMYVRRMYVGEMARHRETHQVCPFQHYMTITTTLSRVTRLRRRRRMYVCFVFLERHIIIII